MPATTTTPAPPAVAPEVLAFAAEQGVIDFLPAVLSLTQGIFPREAVRVLLVDDPEIPDFRHIVLEVETHSNDPDHLFRSQQEWTTGLFRVCPSTHAVHFLLRVL